MRYPTDYLQAITKTALEVTNSEENSNTMHWILYFEKSPAANMT